MTPYIDYQAFPFCSFLSTPPKKTMNYSLQVDVIVATYESSECQTTCSMYIEGSLHKKNQAK